MTGTEKYFEMDHGIPCRDCGRLLADHVQRDKALVHGAEIAPWKRKWDSKLKGYSKSLGEPHSYFPKSLEEWEKRDDAYADSLPVLIGD